MLNVLCKQEADWTEEDEQGFAHWLRLAALVGPWPGICCQVKKWVRESLDYQ